MKKVRWVSNLLLMAGFLLLVGCSQPEVQTPTQYVPRYSADQVISVVRAQYPSSFRREITTGQYSTTPTQISVQFVGGTSHAWKATVTSPRGYYLQIGSGITSAVVYFWESDGGLHQGYVP